MNFNLIGYLLFAFVTSVTPGPNNLMLFSYGRTYGIRESRGLMLGIFLGFYAMLCLSGYGIAKIITGSPAAEIVLKIAGSLWMLYLAFLLTDISLDGEKREGRKIGFRYAFAQQFVNSKAWVMAVSGASAFMPKFSNIHANVFLFASIFAVVGIPCMVIWLKLGDLIAKLIKSDKANRIVGYSLFSLMLVTIATIWIK